jgi:hypothetical protein
MVTLRASVVAACCVLAVFAPTVLAWVRGGDFGTPTGPHALSERAAPAQAGPRVPTRDQAAWVGAGLTSHDVRWLQVLDEISARRERAWRRGDPSLLRDVYAPGSPELAADQAMLRAYRGRGLRVSGLRMRFFVVEVELQRPGSAVLLVVDSLGRSVAHGRAGGASGLPADLPTRHRVELREVGGQWRIARIALA